MRYFAPALILVFALAGCGPSPEEIAASYARAEARADSVARAKAWADSVARAYSPAEWRADSLAQAERRRKEAELQELVAQAFEAEARIYGDDASSIFGQAKKARDVRSSQVYALMMADNAENYAAAAQSKATDSNAEGWRAWKRVAELWDAVAAAGDALE